MWTPSALASECRAYQGRVLRVVEVQHRISASRLADSPEEQLLLEQLAEEVKPIVPAEARALPSLLAAPFRYAQRSPSRFRTVDDRAAIFYASEHETTAIAEIAYWRLLFLSRSPGTRVPRTVAEHRVFTVAIAVERALDLTSVPFAREAAKWSSNDYTACQQLAAAARKADCQAIRYKSARDPDTGANLALLDPAGFGSAGPKLEQSWHLRIENETVVALEAFPSAAQLRFSARQFGIALD